MVFAMKKGLILVCILCVMSAVAVGCSSQSPVQTPSPTQVSSPTPAATQKSSDIWNDTTVFATLDQLNEDTLLATAAGVQRTYQFDEKISNHIQVLEIHEGDDIAIHFEVDDMGNYSITSIEKMLVGR